jgi:hypothetical protein
MALRYYIEKNNVPVQVDRDTADVWAYENESANRRVALDKVYDYEVSTVFLTVDHNWSGEGAPILYETMVFGPEGREVSMFRYRMKTAAIVGHNKCLTYLRNGFIPAQRGRSVLGGPDAGYPMKPEQIQGSIRDVPKEWVNEMMRKPPTNVGSQEWWDAVKRAEKVPSKDEFFARFSRYTPEDVKVTDTYRRLVEPEPEPEPAPVDAVRARFSSLFDDEEK